MGILHSSIFTCTNIYAFRVVRFVNWELSEEALLKMKYKIFTKWVCFCMCYQGDKIKVKRTKTEKYWDLELANETKPIWVSLSYIYLYGDRMLMPCILLIQLWCLSYWSNFAFLFSVDAQPKGSWKGGVQWIL